MVEKITKWMFLEPFVYSKEKLHLQDISRQLYLNHTTVRQYLNHFEKEGVLKKSHKGRLTLYELNRGNDRIVDILTIVEKERLLRSCKDNLLINELVSKLQQQTTQPIIIFGSTAKNYKKANDVDILTTSSKIDTQSIEQELNIPLHVIQVRTLKSTKESLREEILKKHLIVSGSEEVTKWLL